MALVACGSTGEAPALTEIEAAEVVRIVVRAAAGRVPVIAGCTASGTARSVALAVDAARLGADALLCAPPPYTKSTQDRIAAHIRAVSHAASLPMVSDGTAGHPRNSTSNPAPQEMNSMPRVPRSKDIMSTNQTIVDISPLSAG